MGAVTAESDWSATVREAESQWTGIEYWKQLLREGGGKEEFEEKEFDFEEEEFDFKELEAELELKSEDENEEFE